MKTVLYPAIALMNRLSFGMKFGLISVLFFLPLLITSFYLVRDAMPIASSVTPGSNCRA